MKQLISRSLERLRRNDLARNILTLGSGNLVGQIITVAGIPILSRVYGPTAYGFLAIYVSVSALVGVVATGRYEYAILLPADTREALAVRRLSRSLLWTLAAITLIFLIVFLDPLAAALGATSFKAWLLTIPINVVLLGEMAILNQWHTRVKQFRTLSRNRILFNLSTLLAQLTLGMLVMPDIRGLVLGLLAAQATSCIFLAVAQRIPRAERPAVHVQDQVRALVRYRKMPLLNAPTALLDNVRNNGVNLIIGHQSTAQLGQYSMAWRSVQAPIGLIGSAISQVFFQHMTTRNDGKLYASILKATSRSLIITLPLFVAIFFLAPVLFPIVLGPDWHTAGYYAQALTPWLYLNLATSPIATVFVITEKQGRQAVFGVLYTVAALTPLLALSQDLQSAIWVMSLTMTGCLILFIVLALHAARGYDLSSQIQSGTALNPGEQR